jgi:hypothetical protein
MAIGRLAESTGIQWIHPIALLLNPIANIDKIYAIFCKNCVHSFYIP